MKKYLDFTIKDNYFKILDFAIILLIAIIPLFTSFNYRINIYLSWEGAFRMANGEIPYKDFGLPLGFGFWMVPAIFFKIFGPQFITLIKAQVFLNILSGLAFRQILKNFNVQNAVISLSVITFAISYTFMNAWPWYNHTVIVYQLIALAFITNSYNLLDNKIQISWRIILGSAFLILSIFTKQDAGVLGLLIAFLVTFIFNIITKSWWHSLTLITATVVLMGGLILSLNNSFFYWFNYGQNPHSSRMSIYDIFDEFFRSSQWIKFYIIAIIFIMIHALQKVNNISKKDIVFALFTLGILAEASIFQVTSYVPEDNNIFFHSFGLAFLLWYLIKNKVFDIQKIAAFAPIGLCILLFWSVNYWKYIDRVAAKFKTPIANISSTGENVVNKSNYIKETYREGSIPTSQWVKSNWYSLKNIKIPQSTLDGINRLKELPEMQNPQQKKVLNMSELTFLANDIGFKLEKSPEYPLWFHLGVGMFNKQLHMFQKRIDEDYYDVIIYEHLPHLNNFYPLVLREQLLKKYELKDTFLAPRDPTNAAIEIYVKKHN